MSGHTSRVPIHLLSIKLKFLIFLCGFESFKNNPELVIERLELACDIACQNIEEKQGKVKDKYDCHYPTIRYEAGQKVLLCNEVTKQGLTKKLPDPGLVPSLLKRYWDQLMCDFITLATRTRSSRCTSTV